MGLNESKFGTPKDKDEKIKDVYPWGTQWPPPAGAGNYAGEGDVFKDGISGYRDGFSYTSPVGSFNANKHGLFDMGGNLWQWCEDSFDGQSGSRVLRGGAWSNGKPSLLLSSNRDIDRPVDRNGSLGFRVVLVLGARP